MDGGGALPSNTHCVMIYAVFNNNKMAEWTRILQDNKNLTEILNADFRCHLLQGPGGWRGGESQTS